MTFAKPTPAVLAAKAERKAKWEFKQAQARAAEQAQRDAAAVAMRRVAERQAKRSGANQQLEG